MADGDYGYDQTIQCDVDARSDYGFPGSQLRDRCD